MRKYKCKFVCERCIPHFWTTEFVSKKKKHLHTAPDVTELQITILFMEQSITKHLTLDGEDKFTNETKGDHVHVNKVFPNVTRVIM